DLRAGIDVEARGLRPHRGIAAGDLYRARLGLAGVIDATRGLDAVPQARIRRRHLGDRVARAESSAELTKRTIGDAGHRRDEYRVRQRERAELHRGDRADSGGLRLPAGR